jgi:hypothetical protein
LTIGNTNVVGTLRPKLTKDEQVWLKQELAEQKQRYDKIVQEMEALTPQREKWVKQFLERVQTRGVHVHFNIRRVVPKHEIRPRDGRPLQVIY